MPRQHRDVHRADTLVQPEPRAEQTGTRQAGGEGARRAVAAHRHEGTIAEPDLPAAADLPGLLHAAVLLRPETGAVERLDTSRCEAQPGVLAVVGLQELAAEPSRQSTGGRELLFGGRDAPILAAVAADTPRRAWDALGSLRTEITPLTRPGRARPLIFERGDVEEALASSQVVVERTYELGPGPLVVEPTGWVARWQGEQLTLWSGAALDDAARARLTEGLRVPPSRIRIVARGARVTMTETTSHYPLVTALLARTTGWPVKLLAPHSMVAGCAACSVRIKAGLNAEGKLTGIDFTCPTTADTSAADGAALLDWLLRDMYACANVRTETSGAPEPRAGEARPQAHPAQGSWALEQVLDALAVATGIDPLDLRLRNMPEPQPGGGVAALRRCIIAGARAFGWSQTRGPVVGDRCRGVVRGVGMASALCCGGPASCSPADATFAAHFCEVEVSPRSGEVRLLRHLEAREQGPWLILPRLGRDGVPGVSANTVELGDGMALEVSRPGSRAAIANAVLHATGLEVSGAPMAPEAVLGALERRIS